MLAGFFSLEKETNSLAWPLAWCKIKTVIKCLLSMHLHLGRLLGPTFCMSGCGKLDSNTAQSSWSTLPLCQCYTASNYLTGGGKEDGPRLFSGKGHKLKYRKFHLNIVRDFYCETLERLAREVVKSPSSVFKTWLEKDLRHSALADPA